jgi:hypothetical protein
MLSREPNIVGGDLTDAEWTWITVAGKIKIKEGICVGGPDC